MTLTNDKLMIKNLALRLDRANDIMESNLKKEHAELVTALDGKTVLDEDELRSYSVDKLRTLNESTDLMKPQTYMSGTPLVSTQTDARGLLASKFSEAQRKRKEGSQ